MPQQAPSRGNPIQDYITVAERIEKFFRQYPEGRIITSIVEHDAERGFILMRAERWFRKRINRINQALELQVRTKHGNMFFM